jgi:hypothetical protein
MLVLVLCLLLTPTLLAWGQAVCTHFAAPQGSGSACSESQPCTIEAWLANATWITTPGLTLCLHDGRYMVESGRLTIPSTFAGSAEKPITIRARNDGKVTIGEAGSRPVHLSGRYGVLQGVNITGGDNNTLRFHTSASNWKVQRVVVQGAGAPDLIVNLEGTNNLLEDCAVFGVGRYAIAAATSGSGNTVRRCWAQWSNNQYTNSNPTATFLMGYGQNQILFENVIGNWNTTGRVTEPSGIAALWGTRNSRWLGSIFYVLPSDTLHGSELVGGSVDAGSSAQQGNFNPTSNLQFRHNVSYIAPTHPAFAATKALRFAEGTDQGCPPGTGNTVSLSVGVGGAPASFSSSFPTTQLQLGTSLSAAIGQGKSLWTDSVAAQGICKRYVNGTLTQEPLWPMPITQRLIDAMTQAGVAPVNVTATMESLFGPIPQQCRTGGTPPPAGDTEAPLVTLTAPSDGALVSGTALGLVATASDNTAVASVEFQVSGVSVGAPCCNAPLPNVQASMQLDTTTVPNGVYEVTAVARDGAGNTATSAPVRILAFNGVTPQPPQGGPHPNLSCTGDLLAGGKIAVRCMPESVR